MPDKKAAPSAQRAYKIPHRFQFTTRSVTAAPRAASPASIDRSRMITSLPPSPPTPPPPRAPRPPPRTPRSRRPLPPPPPPPPPGGGGRRPPRGRILIAY